MLPRKTRIAILIMGVIGIIFIVLLVFGFLFLNTDIFKSNETLFSKYFIQNFEAIDILKIEDNLNIEDMLNQNKYTSELEGKIEYTENIGTSDENKSNPINDVKLKVNSNIDVSNNYLYKDISIETDQDKLLGLEYLKQNQNYGIRLNGIQQFVSSNDDKNELLKDFGIEDIEKLLSELNIKSICNFTEEEKKSLTETFMNVIKTNVSADKYHKQTSSLITVDNKDIKANSYYIKFTVEEFNNLYIKVLEQVAENEILLSKIDLIEDEIKKIYSVDNLREKFVNDINDKIEEIKNNNIGSDEVRITVYENNKRTIRTSIEKTTSKLILDLKTDSSIKIDAIEMGENETENIIEISKENANGQINVLIGKEKIQNNEIVNDIEFSFQQIFENDNLNKEIDVQISTPKYSSDLNMVDNITFVQSFEDEKKLDDNNVELSTLETEQVDAIKNILNENVQGQLSNLNSKVSKQDYINMFQNLSLINKNSVELPSEGKVTEIERKRFNSQFEFFASQNLTTDNVLELIKVVENNFEEMKVLLENGSVEDLDMNKLEDSREASDYMKDISEILLFVKENSRNDAKKDDTVKFLEEDSSRKYDVSIQYDDDGLVRLMRVKIQKRE